MNVCMCVCMFICMYACMYILKHARPLSRWFSAFSTKFLTTYGKLKRIELQQGVQDNSDNCAEASIIARFKLLSLHLSTENERSTKLLRIASVCAQNQTRESPNSCQEVEPLFHDLR
jgi:hypothetical protein